MYIKGHKRFAIIKKYVDSSLEDLVGNVYYQCPNNDVSSKEF